MSGGGVTSLVRPVAVAAADPELERALAMFRRAATPRWGFGIAELDLTEVTHLDAAAVALIDEAYLAVTGGGRLFRVTPPRDVEARAVFVRAAIGGQFGWARGSAPDARNLLARKANCASPRGEEGTGERHG